MSYNYLSHDGVCYDISQLTKEPTVLDWNNNRFKQVLFDRYVVGINAAMKAAASESYGYNEEQDSLLYKKLQR